ncbi:DUF2851 family protein [Parapedobacter sp. ISTM3]|uniref:DUF2851 family protein n=1 Tax=Parapedobacter sp. ISTM3 TaxID=2800130 RepID=UPI0019047C6D|nr:DUF2851 family protein [Parapedobacter sp. ISTM3]MBK1439276.1 DUF2851 family protein [Parapedobacter sp. ISTM3]
MTLPEDILHFVWRYRLYSTRHVLTVSGKTVTVLDAGMYNRDAGPDFLGARIRIGDTEWAGNVEIHVRASDWDVHRHQFDRAYNNVILHVVYEYDRPIKREDGIPPETLELGPLVPENILGRYRELMAGRHWIPCERRIHAVPSFQLSQWLSRLVIERLERRVSAVFDLLTQQKGDWEETCYIWMARSFGFKVNAQAFEQLARSLPRGIVAKHKDHPAAVEALFFGQAGMLERVNFSDDYPRMLQQEYGYLRKLHALTPVDATVWKFMRIRPANFPTMRIAQFAALCQYAVHLFSAIIDNKEVAVLKAWFDKLPVHPYWQRHYRFDTPAPAHSNQLGAQAIDVLLINAITGILFAYGKYIGKEAYLYRAIVLLEHLKAEDNAVIRRFSALGVHAEQAADSQALLQMKAYYCDRKKCLDCGVGLQLIKTMRDGKADSSLF